MQKILFPNEKGEEDIKSSVKKKNKYYSYIKYFLISHKNKTVGITGMYAYDIYPKDNVDCLVWIFAGI